MVIFLAGMQDVPRQLLEAVEIDGGGFWAKLLHVTIPMMTPTIFYNVVMGIINGFQIFTSARLCPASFLQLLPYPVSNDRMEEFTDIPLVLRNLFHNAGTQI